MQRSYGYGPTDDLRHRNRHDESPSAVAVLLLLLHDLVLEIPGQQKQVVGRGRFEELRRIVHTEVDTGHRLALFMGASINQVVDEPAIDAGRIEENRTLGG